MTRKFLPDDEEPDEEIRKLYERSEVFRKVYDFFVKRDGEFIYKRLKREEVSEVEFTRQVLHQAMRVCSEDIKKEEKEYDRIEGILERKPALREESVIMKRHENKKRGIDDKKMVLAEWEEYLRKLDEQ
jgi:hypothetical protein